MPLRFISGIPVFVVICSHQMRRQGDRSFTVSQASTLRRDTLVLAVIKHAMIKQARFSKLHCWKEEGHGNCPSVSADEALDLIKHSAIDIYLLLRKVSIKSHAFHGQRPATTMGNEKTSQKFRCGSELIGLLQILVYQHERAWSLHTAKHSWFHLVPLLMDGIPHLLLWRGPQLCCSS